MPDFTIPVALLKRPIEKVYDACASKIKSKIQKLRVEGRVESLHSKLWQLQKVKTIWNPDRPLVLSIIYSPVRVGVEIDGVQSIRQVGSVSDLQFQCCILQGTAGQGKSILLKYLVGREIRSGERVPLLYELRNYQGGNLEEQLAETFCEFLGINYDFAYFSSFCENGALSILLDGFDEVSKDSAQQVLAGIERLSQRYSNVKMILTTRPDSGYQGLTLFNLVKIKPLEKNELRDFFKKLTRDDIFSKKLVAALDSSSVGVRELITTPLAATLLAIIYRASGKIPDEFSEFFEELFQVLVVRHDASKLGWRRHRSCDLTDRQLQQAFEAYCFQVRRRRAFSCSATDAVEYAKEGLHAAGMSASPELCLQDIKKVTCLIIEEGRQIEFVHVSVANYFSAKFVKSLAEATAEKFYHHLLEGNWVYWVSELDFLRKIDSVRFFQYFLIPDVEKTLSKMSDPGKILEMAGAVLRGSKLSKVNRADGQIAFVVNRASAEGYSARDFSSVAYEHVFRRHGVTATYWSSTDVVSRMGYAAPITWLDVAGSRGEVVFSGFVEEMTARKASLRQQLSEMRAVVERSQGDAALFTVI
jgi:NACHT domain